MSVMPAREKIRRAASKEAMTRSKRSQILKNKGRLFCMRAQHSRSSNEAKEKIIHLPVAMVEPISSYESASKNAFLHFMPSWLYCCCWTVDYSRNYCPWFGIPQAPLSA